MGQGATRTGERALVADRAARTSQVLAVTPAMLFGSPKALSFARPHDNRSRVMGDWTNFFITAAGASAALAGLAIVAISVNLARILSFRHLPARAAATIGALMLVVVSCLAGLMPQSVKTFGMELLLSGILCWLLQLTAVRQMILFSLEQKRPGYEAVRGITLTQVQTIPFMVAGAMLWAADENGLYWMAAGVIAVFILSMFNTWVLLVEILR